MHLIQSRILGSYQIWEHTASLKPKIQLQTVQSAVHAIATQLGKQCNNVSTMPHWGVPKFWGKSPCLVVLWPHTIRVWNMRSDAFSAVCICHKQSHEGRSNTRRHWS